MTLPPLLKSKFFWSFSLITGGFSSAVAYDRYEAFKLRKMYLEEARKYGNEPLPINSQPRCLAFLLISPTSVDHRATLKTIQSFVLDILTISGIDYKWIIEVDGEEAKEKWDELARERNEPELMKEQQSIPIDELKSNILVPLITKNNDIITESDSEHKSNQIWKSLRSNYSLDSITWPAGSNGYVTFDSFTEESFKEAAGNEANRTDKIKIVDVKNPSKSWWSWSKSTNNNLTHSSSTIPQSNLFPLSLYHFPCTLSQSPLSRLQRFLFGKRHLTRTIGEAVMKCIREEDPGIIQ